MNIYLIEERLADLEERFQDWVAPINQATMAGLFRIDHESYTSADYERDLEKVRKQQFETYDPYAEMYAFFDELCPFYMDSPHEIRVAIRSVVSDKNGILSALIGYAYRCANRIKSSADQECLKNGLAAVSIENSCKDFRDVLLVLSELYLSAESAGVYPMTDFKAVARLSSKLKPFGGEIPMHRMMGGIRSSAVLEESRHRRKSSSMG